MKRKAHDIPVLAALALAGVLLPSAAVAQERSYEYERISYDIVIHEDTTFTVAEAQRYLYRGEYHQGWRSIPHDKLDEITDVAVADGETGTPLTRSLRRLDKEDPSSWGKYASWTDGGTTNIEWYYDLADTSHTWVITYRVHGGLAFYDAHDELYWNLFTDYQVPVGAVDVRIVLPGEAKAPQLAWYTANPALHRETRTNVDGRTFLFSAASFPAYADATIALGFDKGLVDEGAYWNYFWAKNWPLPASAALVVGSILFALLHWYLTERHRKGRGVVIPEYEPPQKLPPAMAELIVRERLTLKAWPATVVDLAVRGYLRIEEDPAEGLSRYFDWTKQYVVTRRTGADDSLLEPYERAFMEALCPAGERFSTRELSRSQTKARAMYREVKEIEEELGKNTETKTGAYERTLTHERRWAWVFIGVGIAAFVLFLLAGELPIALPLPYIALAAALLFAGGLVSHRLFFDARLNERGARLREDWLGFRLYLATAEKHRLQNLTPDTFERYLPYAMIFGLEKKWARAFEHLSMPPPSWYHGAAYAHAAGAGGFSPSSFAGGFSASFSSAFASSGASGASGGGGSAGGGGGGGGGGAS